MQIDGNDLKDTVKSFKTLYKNYDSWNSVLSLSIAIRNSIRFINLLPLDINLMETSVADDSEVNLLQINQSRVNKSMSTKRGLRSAHNIISRGHSELREQDHLHRDNLAIVRSMNSGWVDLVRFNPPFNSNADYAAPIESEVAGAEFNDARTLDDLDNKRIDLLKVRHPLLNRVIHIAMTNSSPLKNPIRIV